MESYVEQIRSRRAAIERLEKDRQYQETAALCREVAILYYKWSVGATVATEKERKTEAKNFELKAQRYETMQSSPKPVRKPVTGREKAKNPEPDKELNLGKDEQELYPIIQSFLMTTSVSWADIGGLEKEVEQILTALTLSFSSHPDHINLKRSKNILLYGPPGTGKTLIASAACSSLYEAPPSGEETEGPTPSFFAVDIAGLISKWVGESSKTIRLLFEAAKQLSPSVVYLDEFESISQRRTGEDSAHESRVKGQILTQLDGFSSKDNTDQVLVIASTNRPWDIDAAVLSRFGTKVYIPLPDKIGRKKILQILTQNSGVDLKAGTAEWLTAAEQTKNFSGRDLQNLFTRAMEHMIAEYNQSPSPAEVAKQGMYAMRNYNLQFRTLCKEDFISVLDSVRPQTTESELKKYKAWGMDPSYRPKN